MRDEIDCGVVFMKFEEWIKAPLNSWFLYAFFENGKGLLRQLDYSNAVNA